MSKTWDFTYFDVSATAVQLLQSWSTEVNRLVVSQEQCPDTNRAHLQGRVTFRRTYRLAGLKKLLNAHWEPTKCAQDSLYCLKEGSEQLININNTQQGARTDLKKAIDAIRDCATTKELWIDHTSVMVRYSSGLLKAKEAFYPLTTAPKFSLLDYPLWQPITVWDRTYVLYGPAGTGKTEWALAHFASPLMVSDIEDLKAFDPDTHDGIVFDDVSFLHWPRTTQIHLSDVDHARSIHLRYANVSIPAGTRKIITTNVLNVVDLSDAAIARRIRVIEVLDRAQALIIKV